jgi:creatinine amidohydrolase/Fe(II)-dependent formamide hydrolase-like protein
MRAQVRGSSLRSIQSAPGQRAERKINNGITGDARRASAALGKRYFDMKVDYAVRQIHQLLNGNKTATER